MQHSKKVKDSFHMTVWLSENICLFFSKNIRNYIYNYISEQKYRLKKPLLIGKQPRSGNDVDWKAVYNFFKIFFNYLSCAN